MNSLIRLLFFVIWAGSVLDPAITLAESPQISVQTSNFLTNAAAPPGICAVSNAERIGLKVTLDTKGNSSLKRLVGAEINPVGEMPGNYLVIRAVDNQNGSIIPVKAVIVGAGGSEVKQIVNVEMEIREDSAVRQRKLQEFINHVKTQELASGAASQALADEATQKNSEILSALDRVYFENRLGRFRISIEYHSTQVDAWNGVVKSADVTVDVVDKGGGIAVLQKP